MLLHDGDDVFFGVALALRVWPSLGQKHNEIPHTTRLKLRGERVKIGLTDVVEIGEAGIERFTQRRDDPLEDLMRCTATSGVQHAGASVDD